MKPRHAAVLALVGWYLIVPPFDCPNHRCPANLNASFSQWHRNRVAFNSAHECEDVRAKAITALSKVINDPVARAQDEQALAAGICVAKDDPRLEGK